MFNFVNSLTYPVYSKNKYVISSVLTYFENKESHFICYKHNKPMRGTVYNDNKIETEFDIETVIPDS